MIKELPVCVECGSGEITGNGTLEWDIQEQKWIKRNDPCDKCFYCYTCNNDTKITWLSLKMYLKTEQGKNDDYANSIGK